ncbi:lytic transglycosylase domain-containing protein [Streptomyces ureilyticus]|uniref:Lytic transglycosylase domain-containing protein n=1 Tax=Streptomyces ureilyticus TaxID=1775131 RepID=A0ABX0DW77_9ACTN|nr:lytic transglycosylase domain-containing protein [Streptomyces ureilyticus]NGO45682.1 lytic transglycosylase domain-containing protein [Streptomyces ureilyticus]
MAAQFGRRLAKGAVTTAVAAAAVAALSASQAPGVTDNTQDRQNAGSQPSTEVNPEESATGNSPYYTDLPPLNSPTPSPSTTPGGEGPIGEAEAGIPATVLDAYKKAEAALRESKPGCNLPWQLLAAIGKVESGQARGGRVDADGTTTAPILGPVLNGNGFANISDTDGGEFDGDTSHDRAVGPMQFIPSTWAWAGRDGSGDGTKDPNNIYDAALAAGHYLCRLDRDMSVQKELNRAILSYNQSTEYLNLVLTWLEYYRKGTHEVPDGTGALPSDRSDDNNSGAGGNPSPTPPGTSKPSKPNSTPEGGDSGSPSPGDGDSSTPKPPSSGSPNPPSSPPPSSPPTSPSPSPTDTVTRLENAGTGKLTATAGDAFTEKIAARTETKAGKAVPRVRVRFTIVGDTDATFSGGESIATVVTNRSGVATAPALKAGEKTGEFAVRATVVGRSVPALNFAATVTARQADALARTSDTALTCAPGDEFADQVEVKATYKGAAADGVAATATLITSADDATVNDKGPYFKDADGKTVRTLKDLETDANGLLELPKLYADDTTGTFLLRITTTGGATLTVELKVAAATASPSPSAS